jgi:Secretion system C-terminal sorting domain
MLQKGQRTAIYPNPNSGAFTLSLHNVELRSTSIKLFDSSGSLIWVESFTEGTALPYWEKQFDLAQRDIYFVVTQIGDEVESHKITTIDIK